jgi:calcineurin-like phosphoesterase
VLRPANLNSTAPGISSRIFKTDNGKIAVAVLLGQNGFNRLHANSPFTILPDLLERLKKQTSFIIIDIHAQASAEKKTIFFTTAGHCSAVIGSHTRVQTADETILNGTAVISDAGRTGSFQSVGGCEINSRIKEYLSGIPDWTKEAWDSLEMQGVFIELDKNGKALSIKRIRVPVQTP